jgi:hypothetical protein
MKTIVILCLLLLAVQVRADLVISEVIEAGGQSQNLTLKIKGDKVRTDVASQMSTITDTNTGDLITILHTQKMYMKMSAGKTRALMDQMRAVQGQPPGAAPAEKPKITDTGKSEKVNEYDTEIYTAETPKMKFTYWVAKDFPNAAVVMQQMKKMQASMESKLGGGLQGSLPDTAQLPGVSVKTQIETNGKTITTTMASVKEQPVEDADMQVPDGYKEMQVPSFLGGGSGAAPASPKP